MRLTTDRILEQYPSLDISGKHRDSVVDRFYGDLPSGNGEPLAVRVCEDETLNNILAVDNWMVRMYPNDEVYKYSFCHGNGYLRKDKDGIDHFIAGNVTMHYNGKSYQFTCFNHHMGFIHGWDVWTTEGSSNYIRYYHTEGYGTPPSRFVHDMDKDLIKKILDKTKKDDEYGYFAQTMIKTIEEIGF